MSNTGTPIDYLQRIRRYYLALGYATPYRWAHFERTPFVIPAMSPGNARVGLVTTAALRRPELGDQGPGADYNGGAKFFSVYCHPSHGDPQVSIAHVSYDRRHTSAEDQATWFPLEQLKLAAERAEIGSLSPRFYGLPTTRSQAATINVDAPALLDELRKDKVDLALLVANCPVCHQSCSLAARHLEQAGIPTVVMGCARDIVEHVGVPRLAFCDFPLGNAAGRPHDPESQRAALQHALNLFDTASRPNTTSRFALDWAESDDWKKDFYNIDQLSQTEIDRLRTEFDRGKAAAKLRRKPR